MLEDVRPARASAPDERRGASSSVSSCRSLPRATASQAFDYVIVISFQVAVPDGFVTVSVPVLAFAGTVTVSFAAETTLNFAGTPWKVTEVVPFRFVPVIVSVAALLHLGRSRLRDRRHRGRERQEAVLDEDRLAGRAQDLR